MMRVLNFARWNAQLIYTLGFIPGHLLTMMSGRSVGKREPPVGLTRNLSSKAIMGMA